MQAGKLRRKGSLQKQGVRVDDGRHGGSIPFVDAYSDVWASIEPLTGRELLRAEQNEANLTHRVRTRFYECVHPSWRFKYKTRVFDIKYVIDEEERHRSLELMCEELVTW